MVTSCQFNADGTVTFYDENDNITFQSKLQHHSLCFKSVLVDLETPRGEANLEYSMACFKDSLKRGEYPFCSQAQERMISDTENYGEYDEANIRWAAFADTTVVYADKGISMIMLGKITDAKTKGRRVIYRYLENPDNNTQLECYEKCGVLNGQKH